ncbi:tRNA (adenosine(37)-N6)-dimethylallyltransferase MiaA [Paramicrobacterium chengjingii]|uniref:tRNA dimethylallyltransferase n=1 Tax=Paramicrobacterium chengjingii TaxID=2769067 RepID=A0ABX6YNK5_9MICO|nr:tRNA (adenosine(37)-N6)-dimethylallyltransferase MiaA [Microbacterium chengjingii]QPZ40280.1 tRNA (adenosine(37)-N6)-dimethylallyltransferase MiaA [Microbacterium chengjingii]
MNSPPVIVIVGATGTGKSDLSLDVAEALAHRGQPAEIINADAMQLYRGMDIGTAKVAVGERRGIPHHMLDVLDITEDASVAAYQRETRSIIVGLRDRGIVPILVGGSGLYVSSVIYPFDFPGTDALVRSRLERELASEGIGALAQRLFALDESVARRIGATNARRIVRALEVAELTGDPSRGVLPDDPEAVFPSILLGLNTPREKLVSRLDTRVITMWNNGLVDEVRSLLQNGLERSTTAGRAIGYAQAASQIAGELSADDAISLTQQLTRRFARRQVSWFKRYQHVTWLDADSASLLDDATRVVSGCRTGL